MRPRRSPPVSTEPAAEKLPASGGGLRPLSVVAAIGGVLLLGLMAMTVVDVIGRYVFNAPLRGATELTELLLAAIIFLGLIGVSLRGGHVTVDLLTNRMPGKWQPWRLAATGLFSAAVLVVVAWRIWVYADQIGGYGGSTTNLGIPIAPLGYFCAICAGVAAALSVAMPMWRLFFALKHRT